jgi:hypothetical protein
VAAGGLVFTGLFLLLNLDPDSARADGLDFFVTPAGSGDCSQASPCALQTALGLAGDGDAVHLGQGTYSGSGAAVMPIAHSIDVYGGWDGATSGAVVHDPETYPVTVDAEGARRGVSVGSGIAVTLEGITVTNGVHTLGGAGVYAQDANLTLSQVTIYSNSIDISSIPGSYAYGAGAMAEGGTLLVEDSTFRLNGVWAGSQSFGGGLAISHTMAATVTGSLFEDNDAWTGGGLYCEGSSGSRLPLTVRNSTFQGNGYGRSPGDAYSGYASAIKLIFAAATVEGNTIRDNRATNDSGALYASSSDLVLSRNQVYSNTSGRISALYLAASTVTATNNIVVDNQTSYYWELDTPAIRLASSSARFLHNTIARNDSDYGIRLDTTSTAWLTNTILVSHSVGISVTAGSSASLEGTLWGSGAWANITDTAGAGTISTGSINIHNDPGFVDPANGDFHITKLSAALDAGVDAGVANDVDGDPRPVDGNDDGDAKPDIGADEVAHHVYLPLVLRSY